MLTASEAQARCDRLAALKQAADQASNRAGAVRAYAPDSPTLEQLEREEQDAWQAYHETRAGTQ